MTIGPGAKLLIGFSALCLACLGMMFIFIRVAQFASDSTHVLTTTAVWLALIPCIFLTTLFFSFYLAFRTWRSAEENKTWWKQFWNVIEVVWLLGSGLSIFNLVAAQGGALIPIASSLYKQEADELLDAVQSEAARTRAQFCVEHPIDVPACALIERLAQLDQVNRSLSVSFELSTAVNRLRAEQPTHPAITAFTLLNRKIFDYIDAEGFVRREFRTRTQPSWISSFILFTPHIFAFVFPLRLGSALAAFRL